MSYYMTHIIWHRNQDNQCFWDFLIPKAEEEGILDDQLGFDWTNWYGTVYMLISVKMWINIAVYLLEIKSYLFRAAVIIFSPLKKSSQLTSDHKAVST